MTPIEYLVHFFFVDLVHPRLRFLCIIDQNILSGHTLAHVANLHTL